MIVTSMGGEVISILENKRGVLIDSCGRNWLRDASKDKPEQGMAGYSRQDSEDAIIFTKPELVRICKGNTAIQQLTTIAEARDFASRLEADLREIADGWNDQQLREVLIEADSKGCSALNLLMSKLQKESDQLRASAAAETEEYISCERDGTSLAQESAGGIQAPPHGNTPKKVKGNAFEGMFGEELVRLTSGQLAIIHAIFSTLDPKSGASPTADITQYVSSEMSAVSAGATIATLKEKKLIVVDKSSPKKVVRLTNLGAQVCVACFTQGKGGLMMDKPYCKCCKYCNKSRCNDEFQWRCVYLHKWVSPNQSCKGFSAGEYKTRRVDK